MRKWVIAATLPALFSVANVHALGLGDIEVLSELNQPLEAKIDVLSAQPSELEGMVIKLASQEAFARIGLERAQFLSQVKFSVERDADNQPYIKVTSRESVREPFLDFLIDVTWPGGQLVREYTVLLDLPIVLEEDAPAIETPQVAAEPTPERPPVAEAEPARARVTEAEPATSRASAQGAPGTYGPVRANENLWSIAQQVRPDAVSMEQTMQALLRANPEAFINANINYLKAGKVLTVPDAEEIAALSVSAARQATAEQNERWRNRRSSASVAQTEQADVASESAPAVTAEAPAARLKLSTPESELAGKRTAQQGAEAAKQGTGAATGADKAGSTDGASVAELQQQVETLQRLLTIKDSQLAAMQQAGALAPADPSAPAPEATTPAAEAPGAADGADSMPDVSQPPVPGLSPDAAATLAQDEQQADTATLQEEPPPPVSAPTEPAPAPERDSPSFWSSPWILGLLAAVAVILAWLGLKARGKKGNPSSSTKPKKFSPTGSIAPAGLAGQSNFAAGDTTPVIEDDLPDVIESDPLQEADTFLSYGRYDEAAELVSEVIRYDANPELRLKLLKIYRAAQDREAYARAAGELHAELGSGDDAVWDEAVAMAGDLDLTEADLIASSTPAPDSREDVMARSAYHLEPVVEEDVYDADINARGTGRYDHSVNDATAAVADDDTAQQPLRSTREGVDDVAIKVDLARAYIDMGDPEGARMLLTEILADGSPEQQQEAQDLLRHIS